MLYKREDCMSEFSLVQRFESDFFERTYPSVINDISVAFSEIVANAWDAGATKVEITIPSEQGNDIVIKDNGSGMTADDFLNRWMTIAYNRVAHQGEYIEYPTERGTIKRLAYGRYGVGRHAMFCFDEVYTVITCRGGECNKYTISSATNENVAFEIISNEHSNSDEQGTTLIVKAAKKLPEAKNLYDTLSYRFFFDPEFEIYINGELVDYQQYINAIRTETISIGKDDVMISIYEVPEGEKTTASTGIAFWVGKRLVGNPSWVIDGYRVEDARRKFALKHMIIVSVDHLRDDVIYDWSGFGKTRRVKEFYQGIIEYMKKYRIIYYKDRIDEVRGEVIKKNLEEIEELSIPSRYELKEFFDKYLEERPEVDTDDLNLIIQALINVLRSRNGLSLLSKLANIDPNEITVLDKLLSEWSIIDIKAVLDEIDGRLKVLDAIEKLCGDKETDELHTLHPLVSQARWLFGVEYDTPNYISNKTLSTIIKEFFENEKKTNVAINWAKRPDLVIASDFSLGATSIDEFDENEIIKTEKVLLIELKKGGFEIKRDEMNQAEEYVDYIYNGTSLNSKPKIKAFVVGDRISQAIGNKKTVSDNADNEYGEIHAYTYPQLIKTAERRLLNLKEKLSERYDQMNVKDYLKDILDSPRQLEMKIQE